MSDSYAGRRWRRFLRGPDHALVDELYVPMLATARRYDRCCSYFSSGALAAAAVGFGELIDQLLKLGAAAPRPAIRLIVNEQLERHDVNAMLERGDMAPLERKLMAGLIEPGDALLSHRLEMLAWLVKEGFLAVRVGVMRSGGNIVHGKFGVAYDPEGSAVVFAGSGNETDAGLRGNYEQVEVSVSWDCSRDPDFDPMLHANRDPARLANYEREFEQLWTSRHPFVATFDLPTAVRDRLVHLAPEKVSSGREVMLQRQTDARLAMLWRWVAAAPYLADGQDTMDALMPVDLWPHQRRVVEEVAASWPEGRLLCDEVGMGKTLEAIAVLRRLRAGRGVSRTLLLVPAGLVHQWQAELREKGGMLVPRLEGQVRLVWPDGAERPVEGWHEALREPLLLVSREAARTEANRAAILAADPFDLVLLDESHAARRARPEEREFNSPNLLLGLLRELRASGAARSLLLLSATPMQTQPWEPWDLLDVLGEGDPWLAEFRDIRDFYDAAAHVAGGGATDDEAVAASALIGADPEFPPVSNAIAGLASTTNLATLLAFPKPSDRAKIAGWMRDGSPLARRMHRNTRATLRHYYELGMLSAPPPTREIDDVRFDLGPGEERAVYDAVTGYIDRRFDLLESESPGKGFVMTIYRRRAASSPLALRMSLERRLVQLQRVAERRAVSPYLVDDAADLADLDGLDDDASSIPAGLPQSAAAARAEIEEIEGLLAHIAAAPVDSKADRFVDELKRITDDGRPALVFTGYADTLTYLRGLLDLVYGDMLATYSGDGGAVRRGGIWTPVSKTAIAEALDDGQIRVLLCTDAASEGLNLQSAGALINYDLPWNPARIEQRIGRIDRIGQPLAQVRVVNLYLRDSVDDDVYRILRARCGLFEHFVGPMQPVLAQARRMLLGKIPVDLTALAGAAAQADSDVLSTQIYLEADAVELSAARPGITRPELEDLLRETAQRASSRLVAEYSGRVFRVRGPDLPDRRFAIGSELLADDPSLRPFSVVDELPSRIAGILDDLGEEISPLVIGTASAEGHRAAVAYWIGSGIQQSVRDYGVLEGMVREWDGSPADPDRRLRVLEAARTLAADLVRGAAERAASSRRSAARRRRGAAARRMQVELGRYLVARGAGSDDLNRGLYEVMLAPTDEGDRTRRAFQLLGDYPEWPRWLRDDLDRFEAALTPARRASRLSGMEVDAAIADPRWRQTGA